jgi:penicillin-binding protein 1C
VTEVAPKPPGPGRAAILYPADGQIIAIDPDIPADSQRVQFQAESAPSGASWRLDGALVAAAGEVFWAPVPGPHRLTLLDADGRELDAVEFEVRGSPVAAPAPAH